jgi:hypothetical protein
VIPKLARKCISRIHQTDIRDALSPIWRIKYPTAEMALQRAGILFRKARLMGKKCDPSTIDAAGRMPG